MNKKLFGVKNFSHAPFILIRASTGCSGNCGPCFRSIKNYKEGDIFYGYPSFLKIFNFIEQNFEQQFGVLFLGKNLFSIENRENIRRILDFFKGKSRPIFIQSSYKNIQSNIDFVKSLKEEYSFTLLYDLNIFSDAELRELLEYISLDGLEINIYVSLEFGKKYQLLLEKYFLTHGDKTRDYFVFRSNKIYLIDRKNVIVGENKLENLYYSDCLVGVNTDIQDGQIFLGEGIEITHNGDIKYHLNPFCSTGMGRVTTISDSLDTIMSDFKIFYQYIKERQVGRDIGELCYECIHNQYNRKEIGKN